jgi:hypothetical protein
LNPSRATSKTRAQVPGGAGSGSTTANPSYRCLSTTILKRKGPSQFEEDKLVFTGSRDEEREQMNKPLKRRDVAQISLGGVGFRRGKSGEPQVVEGIEPQRSAEKSGGRAPFVIKRAELSSKIDEMSEEASVPFSSQGNKDQNATSNSTFQLKKKPMICSKNFIYRKESIKSSKISKKGDVQTKNFDLSNLSESMAEDLESESERKFATKSKPLMEQLAEKLEASDINFDSTPTRKMFIRPKYKTPSIIDARHESIQETKIAGSFSKTSAAAEGKSQNISQRPTVMSSYATKMTAPQNAAPAMTYSEWMGMPENNLPSDNQFTQRMDVKMFEEDGPHALRVGKARDLQDLQEKPNFAGYSAPSDYESPYISEHEMMEKLNRKPQIPMDEPGMEEPTQPCPTLPPVMTKPTSQLPPINKLPSIARIEVNRVASNVQMRPKEKDPESPSLQFVKLDKILTYQPINPVKKKVTDIKYTNGNFYSGETVNGKREGKGQLQMASGSFYEGEFKDDFYHGQGYLLLKAGHFYKGTFENGLYEGFGVLQYPDDHRYEGYFHEGKRHGRGLLYFRNTVMYNGEFQEDSCHGSGIMRDPADNIYEGEFFKGKKHGVGMLRYALGGVYNGSFRDGQIHGFGIIRYKNGAIYEGEFQEGKKCGKGVYQSGQKLRYEGEFMNDTFEGHGLYTNANGDRYDGNFRAGLKDGEGVLHYARGDLYVGNFREDLMWGLGIYKFVDGS